MALLWRLAAVAAAVFSDAIVEIEGLALQTGSRQEPQQQMLIEKDTPVGTSSMEESASARQDEFKQAVRKLVDDTPDYSQAGSKREVWYMLSGHKKMHEFMHLPIIYTLREAFRSEAGISINVVWTEDGTCELERRVAANAGRGPMPVVIANHWFREEVAIESCTPGTYGDLLHNLTNTAYLIFYNDEPIVRTGETGTVLVDTAVKYKVKEVWSYSNYMMWLTKTSLGAANIISRYFPAGCAKAMDFGVLHVPGAPRRNYSQLGFLGRWEDRPHAVNLVLAKGFGNRIRTEEGATREETLRAYLSSCPLVQINTHSVRNPSPALESFRISLLIMNGACVISEPVHPLDEQLYKGVVMFRPVGQFLETWEETLKDNRGAVAMCSQRARQSFCKDFAPGKMLSDSGFVALMNILP